jgi:hypothetical protein
MFSFGSLGLCCAVLMKMCVSMRAVAAQFAYQIYIKLCLQYFYAAKIPRECACEEGGSLVQMAKNFPARPKTTREPVLCGRF